MSRRQGRISNRGNAKVGAGGRQRGYRKAGRVKKAGSKRSECIGSPGKHRETEYRGNAQNVSRGKTRLCGECKEVCCCVCVNEVQVW